MRAMSCGVLLLGGPVVALPALWRACSVLCLLVVEAVAAYVLLHVLLSCPVCWGVGSIREGGGGGRPRPGSPLLGSPPLLLLLETCLGDLSCCDGSWFCW